MTGGKFLVERLLATHMSRGRTYDPWMWSGWRFCGGYDDYDSEDDGKRDLDMRNS